MRFSFLAAVLGAALSPVLAWAQVASHASALKAPAPAPPGSVSSMQVTGKPVARVNGAVLTDRDLLREMMAVFPYARTHNGFPKDMEPAIRDGALKMIEFEELLYQEAERRQMTVSAARVNQALTAFRNQFEDDQQFQQYIQVEMNGSLEQLRKSVRRSLLIEALQKSELDVPSRVTLAEARQYYIKNPGSFKRPEQIQFQTISIMPSETASDAVKEQAHKQINELWQKAKATHSYEEFGLLAEKYSQDDFRVDMGNHKLTARAALPPEILKILDPMKPGQVSGICQFGPYYTILRLEARKPASKTPFEQVSAKLQDDLHKDRYNTLRSNLDKKLRAKAKVEEL
jgi:parvulin-like peptidyl-prolyl isomerase